MEEYVAAISVGGGRSAEEPAAVAEGNLIRQAKTTLSYTCFATLIASTFIGVP